MSRRVNRRRRQPFNVGYVVVVGLALIIVAVVTFMYGLKLLPTDIVEPAASTAAAGQPAIVDMKIQRSSYGENMYVMTGTGIETVALGDLLVVYARDPAGFESDVAITYIVDKNVDNLHGKVIFQNPDVELNSLAALRADDNLVDANLTRMVAIDATFVGFVVGPNQIRLNPNEPIQSGTELLAMELTANGDAIGISPPLVLQISTVSLDRDMANASVIGAVPWPPTGTLLIHKNGSKTHTISVRNFVANSQVCVRKGDRVVIAADGIVTVGVNVGTVSPEGKEYFLAAGLIQTPIDMKYDIVPEFPHGVLMYRFANTTLAANAGWTSFAASKNFQADRTGCLEFDINDAVNNDNSGTFTVYIQVNP